MAKQIAKTKATEVAAADSAQEVDELAAGKMPLMAHLVELRNRILITLGIWLALVILLFTFAGDQIINFLVKPLFEALTNDPRAAAETFRPRFIFTALYGYFFAKVAAAAAVATAIASPLLLGQIYAFVAPGLYKNEKKAFTPFLIATPILFIMGSALVYYVVIPFAGAFFIAGQQVGKVDAVDIVLEPKIGEYLGLAIRMMLVFGIFFQLPVASALLARAGIITAQTMISARRYAIVILFLLAAMFTPPDPVSLMLLALPVVLLYEVSVWVVKGVEKTMPVNEFADDDDDEEYEDFFNADVDTGEEADFDDEELADEEEHDDIARGSQP